MDQVLNSIDIIGSKILFVLQIIIVVVILINLFKKILLNFSKEYIITNVFKSTLLIILIFSLPKIFTLIVHFLETFAK